MQRPQIPQDKIDQACSKISAVNNSKQGFILGILRGEILEGGSNKVSYEIIEQSVRPVEIMLLALHLIEKATQHFPPKQQDRILAAAQAIQGELASALGASHISTHMEQPQ